jgi:hypothetical protein
VGTHEELLQRQRHYWSLYMTGGPRAGDPPARETMRPGPEARITSPERSTSLRGRKLPPKLPADQEINLHRARRFVTRLVGLGPQEGGAATAAHNGNHNGFAHNGHGGVAAEASGNGKKPDTLAVRRVQERLIRPDWSWPDGEYDSAGRVADRRPRVENGATIAPGDGHVR